MSSESFGSGDIATTIIEAAGGTRPSRRSSGRQQTVTAEGIIAARPDVIVVPACCGSRQGGPEAAEPLAEGAAAGPRTFATRCPPCATKGSSRRRSEVGPGIGMPTRWRHWPGGFASRPGRRVTPGRTNIRPAPLPSGRGATVTAFIRGRSQGRARKWGNRLLVRRRRRMSRAQAVQQEARDTSSAAHADWRPARSPAPSATLLAMTSTADRSPGVSSGRTAPGVAGPVDSRVGVPAVALDRLGVRTPASRASFRMVRRTAIASTARD
ncbi:hypothetical protein HBB16_16485 [Pseudonocardia sp. MCCB 268]|nr:hypothetical protein [Pseudonocardia cytotoxica]